MATLPSIVLLCQQMQAKKPSALRRLLKIAMCAPTHLCFDEDDDMRTLRQYDLISGDRASVHQLIHSLLREGLRRGAMGQFELAAIRQEEMAAVTQFFLTRF